jgi:hypothetical protein
MAVSTAFDITRRFLHEEKGPTELTGGIDFIRALTERGVFSVMDHVARKPSNYEEFRHRFEDMHKIMFGPSTVFNSLEEAEWRSAFERVETVGDGRARRILAAARTDVRGFRRFKHRPESILFEPVRAARSR